MALTRTKNNVYLIADKRNPSPFVEELLCLNDNKYSSLNDNSFIEFRKYEFNDEDISRMENLLNIKFRKENEYPTKLNCPYCGGLIVLYKKGHKGSFKCEKCNFDFGRFNQPVDYLDSLKFCDEKGCRGLTYIRKTPKRFYKNCTMYYKTKCNPTYKYDE